MSPNPSEKLKKHKKKRREQYIDAAIAVFQQKGFHNTTIKDITEYAGTSVGNFYIYFEAKEQILEEIVEKFYLEFTSSLMSIETADISYTTIKKILKEFILVFWENREMALLFIKQMGGINKKFTTMRKEYQDQLSKRIETFIHNIPKKFLNPKIQPKITSYIWTGAILECIIYWLNNPEEMEIDKLIDSIAAILMYGTMNTKDKP